MKRDRCSKWLIPLILLTAVSLLFCSGCGKQQKRKLVVGTEATFPPYEFYRGDKIVGIDPEIVSQIAAELGCELEIEDTSFDYLLDSVASGKIDMAASGITITEKRKEKVDFTIPYAHSRLLILVPEQSKIRNARDLKNKLVGVQKTSTADEYATKHFRNTARFPNAMIAVDALASGKLDAVILDNDPARILLRRYANLKLLPTPLTSEEYGIAIRKGQPELLEKLNKIIRRMLADRSIEKITDRYFLAAQKDEKEGQRPLLRVAVDPTFPPFNYLAGGKPAGVEPDMLKMIAEELGMELQFEQISFDLLLKAVQSDNGIDLASSMLSITPERKKEVDFSIPYTSSALRIMLRVKTPTPTAAQLKTKNIGVVFGSTAESYARKHLLVPICYSDNIILVSAVKRGEIDLAFIDEEQASIATGKDPSLKCLPEQLQDEQCAFAVRKGSRELLEKVNAILRRFLADGTIQKLREKHLKKLQKK